eukprot:GHRQ01030521.1.p2 GENE.GHRQ01030521.1~~GHRQ01030521.1.p2  ORF type:complete len:130 (+),score=17.17 GHRQ01030521.1:343-732(+)
MRALGKLKRSVSLNSLTGFCSSPHMVLAGSARRASASSAGSKSDSRLSKFTSRWATNPLRLTDAFKPPQICSALLLQCISPGLQQPAKACWCSLSDCQHMRTQRQHMSNAAASRLHTPQHAHPPATALE